MGIRRRIYLIILLLLFVLATVLVVYIIDLDNEHEYKGTFVENMIKEESL